MKVTEKLLLTFTENMSALINSGLTLMDSLNICKKIDDSKNNVNLCNLLINELSNGESFYDALIHTSNDFGSLYISLIKIGEKTGSVNLVLNKLNEYLKQKRQIKEKIKSSLTYPVIVFVTAIAVIMIIMLFVFPKLENVFEVISDGNTEFKEIAQKIKVSSRITVISVSFILIAIATLIISYKKRIEIKRVIDRFAFKIPFVKNYFSMMCTYDFAFSMKLLCSSGIQIVNALDEAKEVIKNNFYKEELDKVKIKVSEGNSFSDSISDKTVFPKYLKTWVGIGETVGNIANVFDQIYQYYSLRTEYILKQVSGNAESIFILITGIIIFALVSQFVLPIFNVLGRI